MGKRSADNARRFMMDVASRLKMPTPHDSDAHAFQAGGYRPVVQISTDGFAGYREAADLAFGPHARYGIIIKEYRNATMIYTPSEMVGTKRTGIRGIEGKEQRTICTSHVERLNGTPAGVPEAAQPADALLLKEAAEPGSRFRDVRGLLQFLLADAAAGHERQEAADRCYDGWTGRARLVIRRAIRGRPGRLTPLLGFFGCEPHA